MTFIIVGIIAVGITWFIVGSFMVLKAINDAEI